MSEETLCQILGNLRGSAAGPDDSCYSAWSTGGRPVRWATRRMYERVVNFGQVPEDFNARISVLLPKGSMGRDGPGFWGAPETAGPIAASNAVNKGVAAATNNLRETPCMGAAPAIQRGFVKGRNLTDT
eukprot:4688265-Pyramimonas_sp.AAC.1